MHFNFVTNKEGMDNDTVAYRNLLFAFKHDAENECEGSRIIHHFIAECKEKIGVDVEHSITFIKAAIIKKKHYCGVTTGGEIKAVGMEGKKNSRPMWINKVFHQFLEDQGK